MQLEQGFKAAHMESTSVKSPITDGEDLDSLETNVIKTKLYSGIL